MFKQLISEANLTGFAVWGLVIFVVVFAGITVWALTRPRKTIHKWSSIPLADGPEPIEARDSQTVSNHQDNASQTEGGATDA